MKRKPMALVLAGVLAVAWLGGCSSGLEGVDKRLSSMQDEIARVQNQNDRLVERIDAMEVRQTKAEAARADAAKSSVASAKNAERPSLKVVKVLPEDTSGMPSSPAGAVQPGEAADDPSPRPLIKLRGGSGKSDSKSESKGES